jgi:hypothetical protein
MCFIFREKTSVDIIASLEKHAPQMIQLIKEAEIAESQKN